MSDNTINPELWDFPCDMVFKAMADNKDGVENAVIAAIQSVLPGDYVPQTRPSKNGTYISVSVRLYVENKEQVEAIYRVVRDVEHVKMCL
ncbi:DUF493 family protein YbeD [Pleionea sp. CnH1-48]|uniref:DUF493 family protein YbeD n=1 Tax=Pleionea sp. CnH1-48 TaxID=2954494 RepID=UPI0020979F20|nr:DUF493 family protein YbeD [Pleionea sp. CnH1-48]MCO7227374.1 DUF493 family protein YbeD [Pleionea sp. CnH1-48]